MDIRKFFGSSTTAPTAKGLSKTVVKTAPKKRPPPPKPKQLAPKRKKSSPVKTEPELAPPPPRLAAPLPPPPVPPAPKPGKVSGLWPDKYRPRRSQDLVGNEAAIRSLATFLRTWGSPPAKRAALLSGPPGVGKTSTATILCREAGFDAVEYNASDERSRKAMQEEGVSELVMHARNLKGNRLALILDEVDGVSDSGGVAEIVAMVKRTRIPILCTCNDRYSQKVRTLRSHCLDLVFQRPDPGAMSRRLAAVARAEKVDIGEAAIRSKIVSDANGDMRHALNALQVWTPSDSSGPTGHGAHGKDVEVSPFDALDVLFAGRALPFDDRLDGHFVDTQLLPLMVHENYPNVPGASIEACVPASQSTSDGDLVASVLRQENNWSLEPAHGALGSVRAAALAGCSGAKLPFSARKFPTWLGKQSTTSKNGRLLDRLGAGGTTRRERLEFLARISANRLAKDGKQAVPEVVSCLAAEWPTASPEQLKENWDGMLDVAGVGGMPKIPAATKAALTRALKKREATRGAK